MYHHLNRDVLSNSSEMFERHLQYIKCNFQSIFPVYGKIPSNSVCLIFDDAYFDFYYYAFPLLKKYKIKSVLAVPTEYILQDTDLSPEKRLQFKHDDCFKEYKQATFCTFAELKEMQASGLVKIASHSHSHCNMRNPQTNVEEELLISKMILENELKEKVDTFVYPFGKYDKQILVRTKEIYDFIFRIGQAVHLDFNGLYGVNYRLIGDNLKSPDAPFRKMNTIKYYLKGCLRMISCKI